MRTPLLITAAVAVVASTAAAANFDINTADSTLDDLSSGDSAIEDCTTGLKLDVLHSANYDDDINDWYVTGVRVAGDTTALLEGCLDMALSVAIDNGDTNLTVVGPVVLTTDSVTDGIIELPVPDGTDIPVRSATEVTAVVERNLGAIAALTNATPSTDPTSSIETSTSAIQPANPTWIGMRQPFVAHRDGVITSIDVELASASALSIDVFDGITKDAPKIGTLTATGKGWPSQWITYQPTDDIPVAVGRSYSFRANYTYPEWISFATGPAPLVQQYMGETATALGPPGLWGPNALVHRVFIGG